MRFLRLWLWLLLLSCATKAPDSTPRNETDGGNAAGPADAGLREAGAGLPYPLTQQCAPATAEGACRQCQVNRCCESRAKILPDAVSPLIDCMTACTRQTMRDDCEAACFAASPEYVSMYLEHFTCLLHNCTTECGERQNPCILCMQAYCARESAACTLDRTCFLAQACGGECDGSVACNARCGDKYRSTLTLQENEILCGKGFCRAECSLQ
jgi:hypothetical protein